MEIRKLLQRLKSNNIDVALQGTDLEINFDGDELPADLLLEIKNNKHGIIDFLNGVRSESSDITIAKVEEQESYDLSSAQKRLWVLSQFDAANVAYNIPGVFVFNGMLNVDCLENAIMAIINRHEVLRTSFITDINGDVKQYIKRIEDIVFKIEHEDLRKIEDENKWEQFIQNEVIRPFDLQVAPLLRVKLFRTSEDRWIFVFMMHHIISDGWSMRIMINELFLLYNTFLDAKPDPLPPLRIQYKDYAAWQLEQLKDDRLKQHRAYWMNQFEGELPVLELPTDYIRPVLKTYNGHKVYMLIDSEITGKIKTLTQQSGGTLFMSLLAALNVLLYRYTGQEDIVIGSPSSGRDHADLEDQLGYYINTLAFRSKFKGQDTFIELLENMKQLTLGAYEHQVYPFDELIDDLKLKRDISRSALFDVMLVLQNTKINESAHQQRLQNVTIGSYEGNGAVISKFDLLFNFDESPDGLQLELEYNTDLFRPETINRMQVHFCNLLNAITAEPETPVGLLNYMAENEQQQLLATFNGKKMDYADENIIGLFESQVLKTPDATALVFEDKKFSYKELNNKINTFAQFIKKSSNANVGDYISVITDRSEWSVITMISVLKLGCVYIPIDKSWPESRIMQALNASGAKIVITDVNDLEMETGICVIPCPPELKDDETSNLNTIIDGAASSYIIYTSGSTGVPKGVEQTYRMLYNLIKWEMEDAGFLHAQKHILFSSFSFDASLNDAFYALSTGGELHVLNEAVRKDLLGLKDYIVGNSISTVSMPFAALKVFFDELAPEEFAGHCIKEIISTGEQLYITAGLRNFLEKNPELKIFNLYGPSETHVVTGISYSHAEAVIPVKSTIGFPVYNTDIYILDKNMQLVPIGVEGEVYIGGMNLAAGYNGRKDLTDEKFISDPFKKGVLVYKSGDVGKWLLNGEIEYMGRKDNQVKINGYRIETEEIELAIRTHPAVRETVVIAVPTGAGEKILVAYLVVKEALDTTDLRIHIGKILPQYMMPSHILVMDAFPLNSNGKVNKKALPSPDDLGKGIIVEYVPPANEIEKKLVAIWETLLGVERIGIKDNFFESGGHSLKATVMLARIRQEFGIKFSIEQVFVLATIEEMAKEISTMLWIKSTELKNEENTESLTF